MLQQSALSDSLVQLANSKQALLIDEMRNRFNVKLSAWKKNSFADGRQQTLKSVNEVFLSCLRTELVERFQVDPDRHEAAPEVIINVW